MKFDEDFLAEVGLSDLPPSQKSAFLAHTQEELEVRVGTELSKSLSDEQIKEFEGILDNDQQIIRKVVSELGMDFRTDPIYRKLLDKYGVKEGTWEIISEYLSIKWIQKHCPSYDSIVASVADALKSEIRSNAPQILAA